MRVCFVFAGMQHDFVSFGITDAAEQGTGLAEQDFAHFKNV